MIGAARLDAATYEAIEADENATTQAAIVVLLVAVAGAIGAIGADGAGGIVFGFISALIGWIVFSALTYFVGTKLIPGEHTSATMGQLLRTLGFARTPGLLGVLGFIPILGIIVGLVAAIWTLITNIIAIRQALDTSTGRAIGVAVLSFIVWIIIVGILAAIFSVSVA
jgi:hypothetical protein